MKNKAKLLLCILLILSLALALASCNKSKDEPNDVPSSDEKNPDKNDIVNPPNLGNGNGSVSISCAHDVQNGACTKCGIKESTAGLEFEENADGTYTLVGPGSCMEETLIIGLYNNKEVTHIGKQALYEGRHLLNVTIEKCVESIGSYAFAYCTGIANLTLPNTITSIQRDAFVFAHIGSVHLTDLASWCNIEFAKESNWDYYSSNPLSAAQNLYVGGQLVTEVTIPNTVTKINPGAFMDFQGISCVKIPDSVTEIGAYAFDDCGQLKCVYMGSEVKKIGERAFDKSGMEWFDAVHFTDITNWCNVYIETPAISNPISFAKEVYINGNLITKLVIPDGVTSIRSGVFYGNSFTEVVISDSVQTIGSQAFESSNCLSKFFCPDSVTTIGANAISLSMWANCTLTIYCEATSQPSGWDSQWTYLPGHTVVWGHKD